MHEWVKKILTVQEFDLKIAKIAEQLRQIPDKIKKSDVLFADETRLLKEAKEKKQSTELKIKKNESDIASQNAKKQDFQAKTTMIKSNDEYRTALLHIEGIEQVIKHLEDAQIELMIENEKNITELKQKKTQVEIAKNRAEDVKKDLLQLEDTCIERAQSLLLKRQEAAKEVDPKLLINYNRIRKGRNADSTRPCVVPVVDEACGRCRLKVTPQTYQDVLNGKEMYCPHCAALLYAE
ncbi:MAG: C4-type zinc ribbon domain-containing protein [Lentisphaeria bacterium]